MAHSAKIDVFGSKVLRSGIFFDFRKVNGLNKSIKPRFNSIERSFCSDSSSWSFSKKRSFVLFLFVDNIVEFVKFLDTRAFLFEFFVLDLLVIFNTGIHFLLNFYSF